MHHPLEEVAMSCFVALRRSLPGSLPILALLLALAAPASALVPEAVPGTAAHPGAKPVSGPVVPGVVRTGSPRTAASSGPQVGDWRQDTAAPRVAAPTDFRGIPFGAALKDVPGLTPVSEKIRDPQGRYKGVYFRRDEKLTYASADILSVTYTFREEKLYQVSIAVRGEANLFLIKDALISHYGPGRQVGSRYGWTWPDFSLVVSAESEDGVGGVVFTKER